jgi:hypothetical protein
VSFYLIPGGRDTERTPEVIDDLETEGLLTKLESGWHRVDWMDIFSYTYDCDMNLGYYSPQKVSDSTIKIAIINDDSQVPNKRKQFDQLEDKLGVNINLLLAGHSKKPVKRSFGDKLVLSPGTPERILSKSSISDPPQDPVLFEYTIDHSGINITSHNIEARRCIGLKVQLSADDSKDELISNFPDDVPDNVVALIEIEGETSDVGLTKKQIQNVIEQKVAIARVYDERKDTGYSIHTETPKYTKVTDTGVPEKKNTIEYDDSISINDCSLAKQRPPSKQRVDQQNEKTSSEKSKNSQNEKRDTDQSKSSTNESTFTKEKTFTLENPPTPDELPLPKKPDQKANDSEPYPNYLTEYYESFRNAKNLLSIIFQLEGIGINPEDLTDPSVQYYTLLDALISFADTSVLFNGYGPQHQDRIPFSVDSYCEKYGNGDTITDYQVINVEPFSDKTLNIVSEAIGGQELDYVRPCVPGTDVPMPALPDSREELSQAMSLLSIFPAYPPLQTESGVNDRTVPIGEIYQSRFSELDSRHKCDVSHYDSAQPILSESPVPEATPTSENEAESKLVDYGRLSHLFQRITPPNESPMNRSLGVFSLNWYKPNNQSYHALRALAYDNEDVAEAFKPRIRDLIHRRFLLDNWEYDYITVLPSHEENTLNPQLVQLAKDAVLETNIIYTPLLRRTNTAEPQRNKSKVERQEIAKNPSKTLQAQSRLNNDNVLLLDDICTTGSSLIAGSHLLQEAGASRVIGITFGLTPGDSQDFVTEISDPKAVASEIIAGGGR